VLPDIPTIDELGIKNFDATTWHGLVAPARTPKDIVATLNQALVATLDDPAVKKSLGDLGVDIIGGTRFRRLYQIRNSQMDRHHQGLGRQARLSQSSSEPFA
jgi:Tripartite tricarboxylate transporter family receptor